jgi:tetratricopeptide (TPR) repeat protein
MLRLHLVQIFHNLAYYDAGVDFLEEPHFIIDENPEPLGRVRKYSQVSDLLTEYRRSYLESFERRVTALISWSGSRAADVVIFPEYSIPAVLLPQLLALSRKHNLWIVAGSHRVRFDNESLEAYRLVGLPHDAVQQGAAYVPLLAPSGSVSLFPKLTISKWEHDLAIPSGTMNRVSEIRAADLAIPVAILPCMDALHLDSLGKVFGGPGLSPRLIICPSCSPTTMPFAEIGDVLSRHEALLAYVNNATFGQTALHIPERLRPHFGNLTAAQYAVPRNEEAVLEVEIGPAFFHLTRGSVMTRTLGNSPQVYPVVYPTGSSWTDDFSAFRAELTALIESLGNQATISALTDIVTEYLAEKGTSLPPALRDRVRKLLREILPLYDGRAATIEDALWAVELEGCLSPADLAAARVDSALREVMGLFYSKDFSAASDLLGVLAKLKEYQGSLPSVGASGGKSVPTVTGHRTPSQADLELMEAFQNRGSELDRLRDAFRNTEVSVIFLSGPAGIGKSDLHAVFFRKLLPDWTPLVVRVVDGSGAPKLLASMARGIGNELDVDALAEASSNVFRHRALQVSRHLQRLPKTSLVIDDLAAILRSRSGRDFRLFSIVLDVLTSTDVEEGLKVLITSSVSPPSSWTKGPRTTHIRVARIDDRYVERIIERELRKSTKRLAAPDSRQVLQLAGLAGGHPLAARLIAEVASSTESATIPDSVFVDTVAARVAERLLSLVKLSAVEERTLELLSVFRVSIDLDLLAQVSTFTDYIQQIKGLCDRVFLSYEGVSVEQHSILRRHYRKKAESSQLLQKGHRGAAEYFEKIILKRGRGASVLECAELAHHLFSVGDYARATELRAFVVEEVKPLAKRKYRHRDYMGAFDLFKLLRDVAPHDPEILAAIARCHGRFGRWDDCNAEFGNAIQAAKQRCVAYWWIYRDWGQLLARYDRTQEAEEKFQEAEKHFAGQNNPSLKATRAYVAAREGDYALATALYEEALALNPNHHYTLFYYQRMLRIMGKHDKVEELQQRLDLIERSDEYYEPEEYETDWFDD